MFNEDKCKQYVAFSSACERFSAKYVLSDVAKAAGIKEQMLRNKLNPDQPHQLTVNDIISLYHATGDETLIDGLLFCCGLTAYEIPKVSTDEQLLARTVELNAQVGSAGAHILQINRNGRITQSQRNVLVDTATVAIGNLAILINEVESKFNSVPGLGGAIDAARTLAGI